MSTTDEQPLLPCPFCGSANLSVEDARDFISCLDCHTEGPCDIGIGSDYVRKSWNERAQQAPTPAVLPFGMRELWEAFKDGFMPMRKQERELFERLDRCTASLKPEAAVSERAAPVDALTAEDKRAIDALPPVTDDSEEAWIMVRRGTLRRLAAIAHQAAIGRRVS